MTKIRGGIKLKGIWPIKLTIWKSWQSNLLTPLSGSNPRCSKGMTGVVQAVHSDMSGDTTSPFHSVQISGLQALAGKCLKNYDNSYAWTHVDSG